MTTRRHLTITTALATVASLAAPGIAHAQTSAGQLAPAPAPQADDDEQGAATLGDVVVTARRRAENLQDVPLSVTAFSPEALTERRIADRVDLANFTPSLLSITGGLPKEFAFFSLRGQGPAFGATPGVVNYFAEVPNTVSIDGRVGTYFDLSNVQVLAGPQGTLFGKNTTGGNVLFEPARPTDDFGGYAQVEIGNLADRRAEAALNVPIVADKVLLRVAGEIGSRDGYTRDVGPNFPGKDYDDLGYGSVRVSLIVRPADGVELYTVGRYYQSSNNGPGTVLSDFNPQAGVGDGVPTLAVYPALATAVAQQAARGPRRVAYDNDEFSKGRYWQIVNHASFVLSDALTLKNIVSYSEFRQRYGYDYDATVYPVAGQNSRTGLPTQAPSVFTEELQLQGRLFDRALNYTLGGYYDHQGLRSSQGGIYDQFPTTFFTGPLPVRSDSRGESKAVFAQGTLDLGRLGLPQGLIATAGYRYTWDETSNEIQISILPATGGTYRDGYGSYNLALDYRIAPQVHVYATVRDAFKAGGINAALAQGQPFYQFAPERLQDVELGAKSQFRIGRMAVRANLDVYRGNYTNIQRSTFEIASGVTQIVTRSAAKARVQGVDLTAELSPMRGLTFTGAYAYIDSSYTRFADDNAAALLRGAAFPYTPAHKYSVGVSWEEALGTVGNLKLSANLAGQSSFSTAQNILSRVQSLPGYETLSLRADLRRVGGTPIDLAAFMANATDKTYVTGLQDFYGTANGTLTYTYGEPRTYGLQMRYSF